MTVHLKFAHYADIIHVLREKLVAPLLDKFPYLPRAEQRDLSSYLDTALLDGIVTHNNSAKSAA